MLYIYIHTQNYASRMVNFLAIKMDLSESIILSVCVCMYVFVIYISLRVDTLLKIIMEKTPVLQNDP